MLLVGPQKARTMTANHEADPQNDKLLEPATDLSINSQSDVAVAAAGLPVATDNAKPPSPSARSTSTGT